LRGVYETRSSWKANGRNRELTRHCFLGFSLRKAEGGNGTWFHGSSLESGELHVKTEGLMGETESSIILLLQFMEEAWEFLL
jgi:hypothetical protein